MLTFAVTVYCPCFLLFKNNMRSVITELFVVKDLFLKSCIHLFQTSQ
jgi:hypothetical protein